MYFLLKFGIVFGLGILIRTRQKDINVEVLGGNWGLELKL